MIPVGSNVSINEFVAAGCANSQGRVTKCCQHICCDEAGVEFICTEYVVRYKVENCHECQLVDTTFCETELTVLP